jgi:hypothetical protein
MLIPTLRPRAPRRNRPREPLMSVVYILAHFDDEYCALPMIREAAREGLAQRFIYLADYRDAALGERRLQETRLFLRRQGIAESAVSPLGLGSGVFDQNLHRGTGVLYPRLAAAVAAASWRCGWPPGSAACRSGSSPSTTVPASPGRCCAAARR